MERNYAVSPMHDFKRGISTNLKLVPGFFLQDNSCSASPIPPRFGLIDDSATRWTDLFTQVEHLNQTAGNRASYKVLFFGRHGEGFHNVAEAKYGKQAWNDYWSKLNGDGEITWGPDPELTTVGYAQASLANQAWKTEIPFGISIPGSLYSSPLTRALKTCEITFQGILLDKHVPPVVLENFREENGVHTCDKRRSRTYIETRFPKFKVEPDLSEEDLLWDPDVRESKAHVVARAKEALDYIFDNDSEIFISVTAHGGILSGLLTAIGRERYLLAIGGILPMVIKSTYTTC